MFHEVEKLLQQGLKALNLTVSGSEQEKLLAFIQILHQWNQVMNLTAVRSPQKMVGRHILESLTLLPYLQGEQVIDVGSGAGLPGIPLSVMCAAKKFVLLDSNHKKQVFVSQVAKSLGLKNVSCVHSRVEIYQPPQKFSTIVVRAFAPLEKIVMLAGHLLADDGKLLAMMGKVHEGTVPVPLGYKLEQLVLLKVPGELGERHLAILCKDPEHQDPATKESHENKESKE